MTSICTGRVLNVSLFHILEPCYSTKKDKENAGLGLAVVHGIVKNYGGAVGVETAFMFICPKQNKWPNVVDFLD